MAKVQPKIIGLAAVAALVAISGAAFLAVNISDDDDSSQDNESIEGDENCGVAGDNNRGDVDCDEAAELPSLTVEEPVERQYAIKSRNWKPNADIEFKLQFPDGSPADLEDGAHRTSDSDGAADTKPGYFFWDHEPGEPQGSYLLTATGPDRDGVEQTVEHRFTIP